MFISIYLSFIIQVKEKIVLFKALLITGIDRIANITELLQV